MYVPGQPAVIQQLQSVLLAGDQATLLAIDGALASSVNRQLPSIPASATDLVLSAGGNDALHASALFTARMDGPAELLRELAHAQAEFAWEYRELLGKLTATQLRVTVCTIYDAVPDMPRWELAALAYFNDVILREAASYGLPVVDLRLVCTDRHDYSSISPIEPSARGGEKIVSAIVHALTEHNYSRRVASLYAHPY